MRHPHEHERRTAPDEDGPRRGRGPGGGGPRGPRGGGRHRGFSEHDVPSSDGVDGWFAGRLPDSWGTPELRVDRDEITVVVTIDSPATEGSEADVAAAEAGRISRWREETRDERVVIAREAEHRYGRKVAWGAVAGSSATLFTHLSVPVMTRLRQPERQVLDTLVDSGVARSRAEALAWCVRLVGQNADSWLAELRTAMEAVQKVREQGPGL
jgi:hypothetical protein